MISDQGDKSWTLFLDRDGVINKKIDNDYVRNLTQFEWLPGVKDALVKLASHFGKIFIVSNQQGVGKGLMKSEDVETIHVFITDEIKKAGGRIDRIYFAPQLKDENSPYRKPNIGMALRAQEEFPDINLTRSIMVGDSMSDMDFGRKSGMKTVFLTKGMKFPENGLVDFFFNDLKEFADSFK